jgi:hypothetical protein
VRRISKKGKFMIALKVTASSLRVRSTQSIDGAVRGTLSRGDIVEQLEISADQRWSKVKKDALIGWSSREFLAPVEPENPNLTPIERLTQLAEASAVARYQWKDRGQAPRGYISGMALAYARVYCKLLHGDPAAIEMSKVIDKNSTKDALNHYQAQFAAAGLESPEAGINTLRHLFVLLLGLGMRESSGRWCEGRDRAANNTTGDTAEAGLFQTSWNARSASPLLQTLFENYRLSPDGFLPTFQAGVKPNLTDLENFGEGDGVEFQRLSKECPAFAVEFAALGLRNLLGHWGPIKHRTAEVRLEAAQLFEAIQEAVDKSSLCADLI